MYKKSGLFTVIFISFSLVSCSSYSTKVDLEKGSALRQVKKAGIILRISRNSKINGKEYQENLSNWLAAAKPVKSVTLITDCSEKVTRFSTEDERFYQLSDSGKFLKFKSTGVVNLYLRSNEEELKKLITDRGLDGLAIYEVYSIVSHEMQYLEFESVLCVVDKQLSVIYTDRQSDTFDSSEMSLDKMKIHILDKISDRLIRTLGGLNFLKR